MLFNNNERKKMEYLSEGIRCKVNELAIHKNVVDVWNKVEYRVLHEIKDRVRNEIVREIRETVREM